MSRLISRRAMLAGITILAAGCARTTEPEPTPTLETPSIGPDQGTPTTSQTEDDTDPHDHDGPAVGEPSADDEDAVAEHARATMEAFWDTSQPQDQWYANLAATMTEAGGAPFEHTLVGNVVPAEVTGDIEVTWDDPTLAFTATAVVPSSVGPYTLRVVAEGDGWLTESIGFPEEE